MTETLKQYIENLDVAKFCSQKQKADHWCDFANFLGNNVIEKSQSFEIFLTETTYKEFLSRSGRDFCWIASPPSMAVMFENQ